jgi:phage terminase Nu1 subunit (DNA packaging protein)
MPKQGRGKVVGRAELAEVFGVSAPTIDDWIARGCPYQKKGSKGIAWAFKTSEVYQWLKEVNAKVVDSAVNCNEQQLKLRKLAAETLAAELSLAKARNEVAPVEEMVARVTKDYLDLKARLRIIPERLSTRLIAVDNETEVKRLILKDIDLALTALSDASDWEFQQDD